MHRALLTALLVTASAAPAFGQIITNGVNNGVGPSEASKSATHQAQAEANRATADLKAAEDRFRAAYKAQPEIAAAEAELKAAQAELDAAKLPILTKLQDDPNYKAEAAKQAEADAKIKAEFQKSVEANPASTRPASPMPADHDPTDDLTVTAETERLNVPVPTDAQLVAAVDKTVQKTKLREMEDAALAQNPQATQAQAKVDAATQKLKALQLTYKAELLNNPEYKAALAASTAARQRVQQTAAQRFPGNGVP